MNWSRFFISRFFCHVLHSRTANSWDVYRRDKCQYVHTRGSWAKAPILRYVTFSDIPRANVTWWCVYISFDGKPLRSVCITVFFFFLILRRPSSSFLLSGLMKHHLTEDISPTYKSYELTTAHPVTNGVCFKKKPSKRSFNFLWDCIVLYQKINNHKSCMYVYIKTICYETPQDNVHHAKQVSLELICFGYFNSNRIVSLNKTTERYCLNVFFFFFFRSRITFREQKVHLINEGASFRGCGADTFVFQYSVEREWYLLLKKNDVITVACLI